MVPHPRNAFRFVMGLTMIGCLDAGWLKAEASADDPMRMAWEKAATFFPNEALLGFEALGGAQEEGPREARFGYAVALLSASPSTGERLDLAERILLSLAESGTDEFALGSRFLLGRLHQIYRSPMEPEVAASHFRLLIEEFPESRWAQMSLVKLGILVVYTLPGEGGPVERLQAAGRLLERATDPDARRDLNLLVAAAHFHYELEPEGALPYLIAAEAGGNLDIGSRPDTLIRIAELLVRAGRPAEAVPYYQSFVDEFYGDARRFAVETKIRDILGSTEGGGQ